MRSVTVSLVFFLYCSASLFAQDEHHHTLTEQEVGSIHFLTSCNPQVSGDFNRAVALLHSFQYEDARVAFAGVFERDASCAMAKWGIAMSHYHGMWDNGDAAAGRRALNDAQAVAAGNPKTTPREHAYIAALAEIYREDGKETLVPGRAFEAKMAELQAAYPLDDEAAIFHALTLAITAPKTDKTFANQRKCGEILEPIFAREPHHPGIAHYIIHCYDNPVLAEKGLNAARMYAKIAPASAHANHMPSHLFTRVGSWDESISSNVKSAELAAASEGNSTNGEARDQRLHAMDYLEYAYLQSGRVSKAKAVLAEMNLLRPMGGLTLTGDYAAAAIPARVAMELGDWEQASRVPVREEAVPWAQAISWAAIGVGSARSGNLPRAAEAEAKLAGLRDATAKQNNVYWSNQVEVQRREVAAWSAASSGKMDDAVKLARSAAELEESMDKAAVTPGAVLPAREMLAEILAKGNHPAEALVDYERVLKIAPNRFNALYGAARSAEQAGNETSAKEYFQKLLEVAAGEERPELRTAREKVIALKASAKP